MPMSQWNKRHLRYLLVIIVCAALTLPGRSFGAFVSKETDRSPDKRPNAAAPAAEEKIISEKPADPKDVAKMKESVAIKRKELDGTTWDITVTPSDGKKKPQADIITFTGDKVSSKNLGALGYGATNFNLRTQEDGAVTWESMQMSESDGAAFWIGDIRGKAMSGKISRRDKKGNTSDYSFASSSK